jgi:arylformamidase
MSRLIDLSHTIENGVVTYRGMPAPAVCDYLSREQSRQIYTPGTEFQIGRIDLVAVTGTYVDSPFHRFREGKDVAELPLESLADLDAVVIEPEEVAAGGRAIGAGCLAGRQVAGKAVLFRTRWSRYWGSEGYYEGHPHLTAEAARELRDRGAVLVGIDSFNIDSTDDGERPVHTTLLGADIPICEHLCGLEHLPAAGFRFSAVPVKIKAMGTFPVRAWAALAAAR